jgi:hypothetical protein
MVALWLIGYEDEPERSAEICVCEILGRDVHPGRAAVGMGVHPFGDPDIVDDFSAETIPIDARRVPRLQRRLDARPSRLLRRRRAREVGFAVTRLSDAAHARHLRVSARVRPGTKEFVVDYVRGYRFVG